MNTRLPSSLPDLAAWVAVVAVVIAVGGRLNEHLPRIVRWLRNLKRPPPVDNKHIPFAP